MRFLSYKTKIILYNTMIFGITMLLVSFLAVQLSWYYTVNGLRDQMMSTATDVNLYIEEKTIGLVGPAKKDYFDHNAQEIYNVVANYSTSELQLYNLNGDIIASVAVGSPAGMYNEYAEAVRLDQPVSSIRRDNGLRQLWLVSPIKTADGLTIGYIGLTHSLTTADALEALLTIILVVCILLGFGFLFVFISQFSDNFIHPIKRLTQISDEINNGQFDTVIQYKKNDEIGELSDVYNQMIQSINQVIFQLRSERKRLGNVLASVNDGLLAFDEDGNVITSNRYIRTYFDIPEPSTIYDFKYHTFFRDIFDQLKEGKSNVTEEIEVNGRILLISGSPIIEEGIEHNYLFIIRNITQARNLEKEQRKFISSVSHELRTPLTTIIGYTDMLNRRNVQDEKLIRKSLNTINKEGHRLVRLVDDLLNANSIENMTFSINKESIDLGKLLQQVVDQMQIKCSERQIEIAYKQEENLPRVNGDYDRLSQIFINIIHNSMKFSNPGGIIDVVLTQEDNFLTASIRDYGKGIDPAKKDLIFSAFYRVEEDRARNEGEGGAGLGLYLVKQVVDKHNGKIQVDSEVDEGTNITVSLPIEDSIVEVSDVEVYE